MGSLRSLAKDRKTVARPRFEIRRGWFHSGEDCQCFDWDSYPGQDWEVEQKNYKLPESIVHICNEILEIPSMFDEVDYFLWHDERNFWSCFDYEEGIYLKVGIMKKKSIVNHHF